MSQPLTPPDPQLPPLNPRQITINEKGTFEESGFLGLIVIIFCGFIGLACFGLGGVMALIGFVLWGIAGLIATSLTVVQPGETRVIQFFGQYIGTVRKTGLVW